MVGTISTTVHTTCSRKVIRLGNVILKVFIGLLGLVGAAWQIGGPVIPAATLKSLRGATKSDVRRILGEPARIMSYGDWIYERPLNAGYVAIAFDSDDTVRSVNDEQAEPQIFGSGSWYK